MDYHDRIINLAMPGLKVLENYDKGMYQAPEIPDDIAFPSVDDAMLYHDRISGAALRSASLLESAITRPMQLLAYSDPSMHELAISVAQSIAKNHPFIDGNKRTALLCMYDFMDRNKMPLPADSEAVANIIVALVERKMNITEAGECLALLPCMEHEADLAPGQ